MDDFDKKYYKISDVAEFIGVPPATIRYWETEFPDISPKRTATGIRQYTPSDIDTLRIVNYLIKTKGLKLEAAKLQLKHNRNNISNKLKVISELQDLKNELTSMQKILTKRK